MTLEANQIKVNLGGTEVLRGIDLSIEPGGMVAIVGPNGSGKSTLLRTMAGLQAQTAGSVRVNGHSTKRLAPRHRAKHLAFLSQRAEAPALLTVREHMLLGRYARQGRLARHSDVDQVAVEEAMRVCGVESFFDRRLGELSGGEYQRVRIATLLAQDAPVLMLDEPLTGLDLEHQCTLMDLLASLHEAQGRTIVCVLHDPAFVVRFFERVVVIRDGRIAADGPPGDVLTPDLFASVFGVSACVRNIDGCPSVICHGASASAQTLQPTVSAPVPRTPSA